MSECNGRTHATADRRTSDRRHPQDLEPQCAPPNMSCNRKASNTKSRHPLDNCTVQITSCCVSGADLGCGMLAHCSSRTPSRNMRQAPSRNMRQAQELRRATQGYERRSLADEARARARSPSLVLRFPHSSGSARAHGQPRQRWHRESRHPPRGGRRFTRGTRPPRRAPQRFAEGGRLPN